MFERIDPRIMLKAPGKDSEISIENFEKAVIMMTISIGDWIETEVSNKKSKVSDSKTSKDAELLMHATDHLRQYGVIGAHVAGIVTLSIASLWAQSQVRIGRIEEIDLKSQMSWVMQSPVTVSAIQESFMILEKSSKHEAENFVRGVESFVSTFVKCALNKFHCHFKDKNRSFLENNFSDLKILQEFFNGLDEGGHSYVAKVLELVIATSMKNRSFTQDFVASHSDYYCCTVEMLNEILEVQ